MPRRTWRRWRRRRGKRSDAHLLSPYPSHPSLTLALALALRAPTSQPAGAAHESAAVRQALEAELDWAKARVAADRRRRDAPTAEEEAAAAARRLAEMGIDIDRLRDG